MNILSIAILATATLLNSAINTRMVKLDWTSSSTSYGIWKQKFTIANGTNQDIKNITIHCKYFAPSGTLVDTSTITIYEIVKTKSQKTFPYMSVGFIHSQANQSACDIINYK